MERSHEIGWQPKDGPIVYNCGRRINPVSNTSDIYQNNQNMVYLSLLAKSLEQKSAILDELIELTAKQEKLIADEHLEDKQFDTICDSKDELIRKINELDNGFEQLYQRIKTVLNENPEDYSTQIEELKRLITDVTDKGIRLQVMERHNKDKIDSFIKAKRNDIKSFKVNSRTAAKYYSNISKMTSDDSYFFDEKK